MTDKQIKEPKNGFYCIEPCYEIKELKEKLLSKEQECEELKKYEYHYLDKFLKLKDCLTEIKDIVSKNYKTEEELFKIRHSRLPKFSMGALNGRHNLASEIIQKISECEGNDENL